MYILILCIFYIVCFFKLIVYLIVLIIIDTEYIKNKLKINSIKELISMIYNIIYRVLECIIAKIIVLYSKFYLNCKNNLKYSYIIPFIFKSLGAEIPKMLNL